MKIGVSLDGVLRNFLGRVEEVFEKYFLSEENAEIQVLDYDLEKWLDFPEEEIKKAEMSFDPDFNEEEFMSSEEETSLENKIEKTTVDEFLHEKCTLDIFGYANEEISLAVETLNQLILNNPKHEFIIISREGGMAIPSTLFFLAKTKSICPNIKFVKEYSKVWDYVDLMITDHPMILNTKPKDKLSVIIDKEYNKEVSQLGQRVKTIKEIDERFLDNLALVIQGGADWSL